MATAKPKSKKSTPPGLARLYRPGVLEASLKIIAKEQDAAAAKKDALAAEYAPKDEYISALAAKCVADVRYNAAVEKRKAEGDAKDEEPKVEASRAFARAFHAWLAAKTGIEEPLVAEEEQAGRFRAESDAERRLMITPAIWPDQLWQKLQAFEAILGDELASGPRINSVLLLALGSIKQDIVNMELLEAAR